MHAIETSSSSSLCENDVLTPIGIIVRTHINLIDRKYVSRGKVNWMKINFKLHVSRESIKYHGGAIERAQHFA